MVADVQPGATPVGIRRSQLNLERRGLRGAIAVGAIFAFFAVGLPVIAAAVPPPGDEIQAGTVLRIPDGHARFTPITGWSRVEDGVPKTALALANGSISFRIASFAGSDSAAGLVDALQGAISKQLPTAQFASGSTVQTTSGLIGIVSTFTATQQDGFVAAYTDGTTEVVVSCVGASGAVSAQIHAIGQMMRSIEPT